MKSAGLVVLAAVGLLGAATSWAVVRPARTAQPPQENERVDDELAARARSGPPHEIARTRERQGTSAYVAQLESTKRAFAAEARDESWASLAEAELGAAIESGFSVRATTMGLADDLQVECRSRLCRVSVAIPPGRDIASLPVAAEMADTLQRAAAAIGAIGRVIGENAEADAPQKRRYAIYVRRHYLTVEQPKH